MRRSITEYEICNLIRMLRSNDRYRQRNRSFLIVEGGNDLKVYGKFIDDEKCEIVSAFGRPHVLRAMRLLERSNFQGVLAIIDADFWHFDGRTVNNSNTLLTDTHDLETMILSSPVLENLINKICNPDSIETFGNVCEKIFKFGQFLGCIRWVNERNRLRLNFKGLDLASLLDEDSLEFEEDSLLSGVFDNSPRVNRTLSWIKREVTHLKRQASDKWQVCQGHDLIEILLFALKKASEAVQDWEIEDLEAELIGLYDLTIFSASTLYTSISEWEADHMPYIVLE